MSAGRRASALQQKARVNRWQRRGDARKTGYGALACRGKTIARSAREPAATGDVLPAAVLVRCNRFVVLNVLCKCARVGLVGGLWVCGARGASRGCVVVFAAARKIIFACSLKRLSLIISSLRQGLCEAAGHTGFLMIQSHPQL